jgi:predicted nucleic acid-binding protein
VSVLADTSIWVDYLRGQEPVATQLERLVRGGEAVLCGPVLAELLAGARTDTDAEALLDLTGLRFIEATRQTWRRSGEVARALREVGESVPLLDILIGIACAHARVPLWTHDRHFAQVRAALPELELYVPG